MKKLYGIAISATISIIAALSTGCKPAPTYLLENQEIAGGFDVEIQASGIYRMRIGNYSAETGFGTGLKNGPVLNAYDYDKDHRIDEIQLTGVPAGHTLEKIASVQKLSEIEESVLSSI